MAKRPQVTLRPYRTDVATHSRTTVATDTDTVILASSDSIYRSIQVVGTAGSILIRKGATTVDGTLGDILNPALAAGQGGAQWETYTYMGPIALRAIGAPVAVSISEE